MASSASTSGSTSASTSFAKPLTAEEEAQRKALNERAAIAERKAAEAARQAQLAAMPNLVAFADAVIAAGLDEKVAAILASSETLGDSDTVVRLDRIKQFLSFDFKAIVDKVQALRTPIDPLPMPALPTPAA